MTRLLADAGVVALASLVSPLKSDRETARALNDAAELPFIEVYVATTLAECEKRDPKGLYARARSGQLAGMTGVDAPYEPPDDPDLLLDILSPHDQSLLGSAAQAAPNDAQLWTLLGYAARLNHQYALSVDAYSHGLRLKPSSLDGMSGLAQTYSVIGRTDDAMKLLKQVVAANPGRVDDSLLLGELLMRGGDYSGALDYFRRAEQRQPATRSEVLLALAYQHLKQFGVGEAVASRERRGILREPREPFLSGWLPEPVEQHLIHAGQVGLLFVGQLREVNAAQRLQNLAAKSRVANRFLVFRVFRARG